MKFNIIILLLTTYITLRSRTKRKILTYNLLKSRCRLIGCSLIVGTCTLGILINFKLVILDSLKTPIGFPIFLFLYDSLIGSNLTIITTDKARLIWTSVIHLSIVPPIALSLMTGHSWLPIHITQ